MGAILVLGRTAKTKTKTKTKQTKGATGEAKKKNDKGRDQRPLVLLSRIVDLEVDEKTTCPPLVSVSVRCMG